MSDWRLKELRGERRRNFLKMMGVAATAVGIERVGLLNYLADEGNHGLAEAAINSYGRSLIVPGPNGSQAWFTQLWPFPDIAAQSSAQFSWLYSTGHGFTDNYKGTLYTEGDRPMFYGPDAPWFDHQTGTPKYHVTGYVSGNDETHTEFPKNSVQVGNFSLMAVAGALGAEGSTSIVPMIGLDPVDYQARAPGAPDLTTVPSAGGMVDLFNSAASQYALKSEQDRYLFETYYKALLKLRKSSERQSWAPQMVTTRNAARILGLNFAADLTPSAQDLADFGITEMLLSTTSMTASQKSRLENFGRSLITTSRAFRLGLSKSAILALSPGPTGDTTFTDPHVTFNNNTNKTRGRNTTRFLGKMLDAFYADLAKYPDPESPGDMLDQTTVFVAFGDTPHTPLKASAWPDATPDDGNWMWVMDPKGNIKNGWFGQCYATKKNGANVHGFDPKTGDESATISASECVNSAGAAVSYAIAQGDTNKANSFFNTGEIPALLNKS